MSDGAAGLLDLLEARAGIVCAVGAGGKKSLLSRLAAAHPGRVAITATVYTTAAHDDLGFAVVVEPEELLAAAVAAVDPARNVVYASVGSKPGRRGGVSSATIERLHREGRFAATYVKADGARMRLVKAPADGEPLLPPLTTTVVPIVSAAAFGQPLSERTAHRLESIERVAGLRAQEPITALHVGRLLASPLGLLKGTEGRRVVPVVNMVDDAAREAQARAAAELALSLSDRFDRVVLACLLRDDPVVAVVHR